VRVRHMLTAFLRDRWMTDDASSHVAVTRRQREEDMSAQFDWTRDTRSRWSRARPAETRYFPTTVRPGQSL
jgi:hypothetical protein